MVRSAVRPRAADAVRPAPSAPLRGPVPRRRALATLVAAPAIALVAVPAGGGWAGADPAWLVLVALTAVVGASVLATYVPLAGQRTADAVGCSPCAAVSALAVAGAVLIVGMRPHDVGLAALALAVTAVALGRRRVDAAQACPAPSVGRPRPPAPDAERPDAPTVEGMPTYSVNDAAVRQARTLIGDGSYDTTTEWSDAAPSTDDENRVVETDGYDGFGAWHLAVDPDASEDTKGRYAFPYGDFRRVNRAALIHAKQRAAQNGHDAIEKAADDLLDRLDKAAGSS